MYVYVGMSCVFFVSVMYLFLLRTYADPADGQRFTTKDRKGHDGAPHAHVSQSSVFPPQDAGKSVGPRATARWQFWCSGFRGTEGDQPWFMVAHGNAQFRKLILNQDNVVFYNGYIIF